MNQLMVALLTIETAIIVVVVIEKVSFLKLALSPS
jgi:hypothetical protein